MYNRRIVGNGDHELTTRLICRSRVSRGNSIIPNPVLIVKHARLAIHHRISQLKAFGGLNNHVYENGVVRF